MLQAVGVAVTLTAGAVLGVSCLVMTVSGVVSVVKCSSRAEDVSDVAGAVALCAASVGFIGLMLLGFSGYFC